MTQQVQTVNIEAVEINGRDFYPAFTSCSIYEDMYRNSWSGHIDVKETESVRETMPIIGEEFIVIRFASVKPVSGEKDDIIQFVGKVTSLADFREGNAQQRRYRLYFQSLGAEVNKAKRVRKFYEGTATSIASSILGAQLNKQLETVDAAKYDEKFVFPNWSPFKCINYLATVSVSKMYNDPFYLFYEDRDGYHFTTMSQLMDKPKSDTLKVRLIKDSKDKQADELLTSAIVFDPLFDVLENQEMGMYGGTLITYDKVKKKFEETTKTYSDTYGQFTHVGREKLTKAKAESPKNSFQFIMTNEPESPGVYSHVKDWALPGQIRAPQIRGQRAHMYLNRGTHIKIGDVIEWDFLSTQDTGDKDKLLSGNWMVTRIRHVFNQMNYNAHVEIIKDGYG